MPRARDVPVHYLRPNERVSVPSRCIYLDTETSWRSDGAHQEHTLRLWCAISIRRDLPANSDRQRTEASGETADELADWIERTVGKSNSWWLYAHNLNFDLAVTALPLVLARRGWTLGKHALATDTPWAVMRRGRAHITFADSWSWLPTSIGAIGEMLGVDKPELPANSSDATDWYERCRIDVLILATAMERLIEKWQAEEAGNWGITGAGSGWSYMRHICRDAKVLISPDQAARRFERAAISGGRRELAYKGMLERRWYAALDAKHAFATVCRDLPLPVMRGGHISDGFTAGTDIERWGHMLMADCLVRTTRGAYSVNVGGGWFNPDGIYWARLTGPEIADAHRTGELMRVGEAYWYHLGHYMRPWAERIINVLESKPGAVDPLWYLACKSWSRTVPGRWAVRAGRVEWEIPWPADHWEIEDGSFGPDNAPMRILSIPPLRQYIIRDQDGESSFPAVLAWIQAHVRLRLNALLDALGDAWLQCNTDGAIVDVQRLAEHYLPAGRPLPQTEDGTRAFMRMWLAGHSDTWSPLDIEIRDVFFGGELISPQHLRVGGELRMAGVPRNAKRIAPERYRFNAWGKLPSQIRDHPYAGYTISERSVDMSGTTTNRWHLADGRCETPVIIQETAGGPMTVSKPDAFNERGYAALHETQHPFLARAMRDWG